MAALSEEVGSMVHSPTLGGEGGDESPERWSLWVAWPSPKARVAPRLFILHRSLSCEMVTRSRGWPGVWWGWDHLRADASVPPPPGLGSKREELRKSKLGAAPRNT